LQVKPKLGYLYFMKIRRRDFIKAALFCGGSMFLPAGELYAAKGRERQWTPAYGMLESDGKLAPRIEQAYEIFEECRLCPRECGVNRLENESGFCRAAAKLVVYSTHPHLGEEVSLVGRNGSGTIFFSNCNLRCVFCQN
jgi:putative pyruvate formate lyase activating enzyme